jgi:hypothetical protein
MSGRSYDDEQQTTINDKSWIDKVFKICKLVGHYLPLVPECNSGTPGKFYVTHAEKQPEADICFSRMRPRASKILKMRELLSRTVS